MNILFVVGSIRKASYNQIIANYLMEKYKDEYNIRQTDISSIPIFSEDIEKENWPMVDKAREDVEWADGIVLVTPENNYSVPAVLKNYLDWCSRGNRVYTNKPVMITGGSTGHWGTIRSQGHLRQIMRSNGLQSIVVPRIEVYFPKIQDSIEDGKLLEDKAKSLIKGFEKFTDYIKKNEI
ncbi:NAD(P)H-dependent FMN reductase [Anaerosphaera aminiphila DSM 21120]|uniref:NAD(P)H-dependent FMN reductase n=1 Tax=Anaerosphaera aminiphila DSM 21120 TaxID=1120995 RepID=A0A1M5P0T6_9FIRM|nr:NADPH-dependent FMN reductase [Anaerosphaera aminiphila]SHG95444.1 NAD(P)H-dependent FMN reductase [Anaerosphaera aminiphila DSM 21120]